MLHFTIESTQERLKRRDKEVEELLGQIQTLETTFSENELQHSRFREQVKKENRAKNGDSSTLKPTSGGYTITTASSFGERISPIRRNGTYNETKSETVPMYDHQAGAIKDIMKVLQSVVMCLQEQQEDTKNNRAFLETLDKNIEQLEEGHRSVKRDQAQQLAYTQDLHLDFEEHKKLLQQLVSENNELQSQVNLLKRVEMPAIRQQLMQQSGVTERPVLNLRKTSNHISQEPGPVTCGNSWREGKLGLKL